MASLNFTCSICHYSSRSQLGLSDHQRDKGHTGYDFRCSKCAVSFTTFSKLEYHIDKSGHHIYKCACCHKIFSTANGRSSHTVAVHHVSSCTVWNCYRYFQIIDRLQTHQTKEVHWACNGPLCTERFNSEAKLTAHRETTNHWDDSVCLEDTAVSVEKSINTSPSSSGAEDDKPLPCLVVECRERFMTVDLRRTHLKEHHNYCFDCLKPFSTPELLKAHRRDAKPHVNEIKCLECSKMFATLKELKKHGKTCKPKEQKVNNCEVCDKSFSSATALDQHNNSIIHKPLSNNLTCLGGCRKSFAAPSSMVMHLESGSCTGEHGTGIDKKALDKTIFEHDVDGIICHGVAAAALLTPGSMDDLDSASGSSTPGGVPVVFTPSSSHSVGGSEPSLLTPPSPDFRWMFLMNPLLCPLCPPERRQFVNSYALEQHLASPVHAPKIYHCPEFLVDGVNISSSKRMDFASLSSLTQHLEAGACAGGGEKGGLVFRKAVKYVEGMLKKFGMGEVKLIG